LSEAHDVFNAFREQQRRTTLAHRAHNISANHFVPRIVISQLLAEPLKFQARIILGLGPGAKPGWADKYPVSEGPGRGLLFRIDAIPHRAALHEDDRVMTVFARKCGGQAGNEPRFSPARDQFKAPSGQVMAFINHKMTVISDPIIDCAFVDQALHQGHIQHSSELFSPASKASDGLGRNAEKFGQTLDPLVHELAAMHKDQGVHAASRDEPGSQHGFAETRRGSQNACIVYQHRLRSRLLFRPQCAAKRHIQGNANEAFIPDYCLDLQFPKSAHRLIETTTGKSEMQ
jgi:hypothetical protein